MSNEKGEKMNVLDNLGKALLSVDALHEQQVSLSATIEKEVRKISHKDRHLFVLLFREQIFLDYHGIVHTLKQ